MPQSSGAVQLRWQSLLMPSIRQDSRWNYQQEGEEKGEAETHPFLQGHALAFRLNKSPNIHSPELCSPTELGRKLGNTVSIFAPHSRKQT